MKVRRKKSIISLLIPFVLMWLVFQISNIDLDFIFHLETPKFLLGKSKLLFFGLANYGCFGMILLGIWDSVSTYGNRKISLYGLFAVFLTDVFRLLAFFVLCEFFFAFVLGVMNLYCLVTSGKRFVQTNRQIRIYLLLPLTWSAYCTVLTFALWLMN